MYFMAGETLSSADNHMRLVDWNLEHGHVKAAANELRKAQNVLKERLVPEMEGLAEQIMLHGRAHVLKRFPDLADIVDNMDEINERTQVWLKRKI